MQPPKFHVGQAVTPLPEINGASRDAGITTRFPPGAIYTVNYLEWDWCKGKKTWYIGCEEWPRDECAAEFLFAPVELLPAEALAALLAESLEPVTA